MTREEDFRAFMAEMEAIWNLHAIKQPTRDVFAGVLADIPVWQLREAVKEIRRRREWIPTAGELREQVEHLPDSCNAEIADRFLRGIGDPKPEEPGA